MRRAAGGRRVLWLWGPVVLYGAGIFWLSHQPSLTPPLGLPDWPMHVAEYAGLGALTARILARTGSGLTAPRAVSGIAACTLFGALDEVHQSFVPGRTASMADVAADMTGAALALCAGVFVTRALQRRRRAGAAPIEIRLFGRQGCHLCDEAEKVLNDVCSDHGCRIIKVDVDADPELRKAYGDEVPVVTINGRRLFKYRVEPDRLARVLASYGWTGRSR